jgi:ATP-dependent 26S proteasome regulatory subunit
VFSKYFSESGKLVGRLFDQIEELAQDTECLVFILIDEIESISSARSSAFAGSEPTDSIRVAAE